MIQIDTESIRKKIEEILVIAGNNLLLFREHCKLSLREVDFECDISYPQVCRYEKSINNLSTYTYLITCYRTICKEYGIGEPEGIVEISSLLWTYL